VSGTRRIQSAVSSKRGQQDTNNKGYISGTSRRAQNFEATDGGHQYGNDVEQLNIEIDNGSLQQED
jgi:hypothetical protein